jgi:glycosyltransferase involved in cell wall biosynthesis
VADNSGNLNAENYSIEFVDVWFGEHPATYLIPNLRRIIEQFQPHLIYCEQEPICFVALQTAILAKKIPVIFLSWENTHRKDVHYRLFSLVRRICFGKSLFMVAGSEGVATMLRTLGYTNDIYVTPHLGVSQQVFFCEKKGQFHSNATSECFLIGYVGRFVEAKDVSTLIQAVHRLDGDIDWHLSLLGDGPEKRKYRALTKNLGIEGRVTFHEAVPHEQVPLFLNDLDVLVLPSKSTPTWKEQFGHVLIEAMACGVPVVGSSSGEIPNVIGGAGLVFQEGDHKDLSLKLESLHHNPQLRSELQKSGLKRVKEKFTDEKIAANMIALYEIALDLARSTPNTLEVNSANVF